MTAINRGLRSKRKRKELDSRIAHTHTTHNSNDDGKFENLERLTADELVDATRLLKRQKRQIEVIRRRLSVQFEWQVPGKGRNCQDLRL